MYCPQVVWRASGWMVNTLCLMLQVTFSKKDFDLSPTLTKCLNITIKRLYHALVATDRIKHPQVLFIKVLCCVSLHIKLNQSIEVYSRDVCWLTQRHWKIEGEGEEPFFPTLLVRYVKACPKCSESGILY